jgi:hypothetical protein
MWRIITVFGEIETLEDCIEGTWKETDLGKVKRRYERSIDGNYTAGGARC